MNNSKTNVARIVAIFLVLSLCLTRCTKLMGKNEPATQPDGNNQGDMLAESVNPGLLRARQDYEANGLKGMWISYLEFKNVDFTSKDSFCQQVSDMFANCAHMGLNTVIVHVRAFGDAFYKSNYFPYSHIMTGTQGVDPGFDPLEEMVKMAHDNGLRIEAWVNPYRVKLNAKTPEVLSADNPANNADLLIQGADGLYYNPGLPAVRQLVVNGVKEIVENYDVDGIHFDDYFYPDTGLDNDKDRYEKYVALYDGIGRPLDQEEWRRENVNILIREVYARIKQTNENVVFGISPQGNNYNNYYVQYSDVGLWLSEDGYVDYIMPQIYWGFYYRTKDGSDKFAFENVMNQWAEMPRNDHTKLYIGLGAYRIGDGDGGNNPQDEWLCGGNLTRMVERINNHSQVNGYTLYRYDSLFRYGDYDQLQKREVENLTVFNCK